MPRLTIQQTAAPDLSATGQILAQAGKSFDRGLESAKGLLGTYQEGQQSIGDNSIANDLLGISNEQEFDAYLATGALEGKNLSPAMRQRLAGMRDGSIAFGQARANTDSTIAGTESTRAATGRANAQEGRTAAEYLDMTTQRGARRDQTGAVLAADAEGRRYGTAGVPQGRTETENAVFDGMVSRGIPEHIAQGFMMNFADESGFDVGVTEGADNVHGTRGKGLYQLTGPRRDAFEAKYGNDYSIDNQLDFMMEELGGSESAAWQKIQASTTAGEAGAAIVSGFLRPAEEHRNSRSNAYLSTGSVTQNNPNTPAADALRASLAKSGLDPETALQLQATARTAREQGQTVIDQQEALRAQGITDKAILDAITSDTNLTTQAVTSDVALNTDSLTPTQRLAAAGQATAFGNTEAGAGIIAPTVANNPLIGDTVANENADASRQFDALPTTRIVDLAKEFEADPTAGLIKHLRIGEDGETRVNEWWSNFDDNDLRTEINEIARLTGVTPAVAAAGMAEVFVRDPNGRNTVGNRFDRDEAIEYIKTTANPDALRVNDGERLANTSRSNDFQSATLQLTTMRTRHAKMSPGPEKDRVAEQIQTLEQTILSGSTPGEAQQGLAKYIGPNGMAARLQELDPNSAEHFKAVADLETAIQGDNSLSPTDRRLLLSTIKG